MKTAGLLVAILALVVAGCGGGPDPDESVRVKVVTTENLNFYNGSAHSVDVYFYRLEDTTEFTAAKKEDLLVEGTKVPGGVALQLRTIRPDKSAMWKIGKTLDSKYTHIGVLVNYMEPDGPVRLVYPWDEELKLSLESRSILSFTENED